ncbi:serine/threonine-protein kinase [Lysobacter capsici]|uniref:serine/threonine-protein kinase n=1 Tax=Lysobacter capsici TaxID=435897 RepID=UPI001BFFDD55|nr:serine/threonine-protein kinase [Lysobacter capsici]QWF16498.1 serine/threonine-protein kinase [Lysobacter capsici]
MHTSTSIWSQAADVFVRALDLDPAQREAFIDEQCAGQTDPAALREAVQRLIDAHQSLDESSGADAPDAWQDAASAAAAQWIEHDAERLEPGSRAGPFVIERELGVGGMGRVYLARREIDQGEQRVALKVAAFHRLAPQVRQRLRRERQLLATLEHPNIARLIDAGELPPDRPYFAMEYVDGEPIVQHCDRLELPLRARIELVVQVLSAVEYAHQRLVLHRDIKAGNVLVDRDGRPKLLDFGIAKALTGVDAPVSLATADAQAFFSPASAAPEQVLGAATDVATDVYALGALMYELFAGELPLTLEDANPALMAHAIVHTVPALPSRAVARLDKQSPERAAPIARHRRCANARALVRQLQGDLDAIVARCLRKEPEQRYASVERLAADLRAVLESRPIAARRTESLYRLGKFARRHAAAIALAAIACALTIGFVTSTVLQSRQLAIARDRAEARRAQAEDVTQFMIDLFRASDPAQARGRDPGARELLARGSQRLQAINDPETHAALAATIADIDLSLGDYDGAERHSAEALRLLQGLPQADPTGLRTVYRLRARVALARADYPRARGYLEQALRALPAGAGGDTAAIADERLLLRRLQAELEQAQGHLDIALRLWESVDGEHQRRYGNRDLRSIETRHGWVSALRASGQQPRAALLLAQLPALDAGEHPDTPAAAESLYNQARQKREQDDYPAAERLAQEALRVNLKLYGERHSHTAAALNLLGTIAQARGDYRTTAAYFERSLQIKRELKGDQHPHVAAAEYNLGLLQHMYLRDPAGGEKHLHKAVDIATVATPEHMNLAMYRLAWAMALHDLGRDAQAREALVPAMERFKLMPGHAANLALAEAETLCLGDLPTPANARRDMADALTVVRTDFAADNPRVLRLQACQARLDALAKR